MQKLYYILVILICVFLTACKDKIADSQIVAQVGNSVLTVNEMRMQVPMGLKGEDSLAFVRDYVDNWVNENMLYEQGLRNLPDLDIIEKQVADYRRSLIAQNYENDLIKSRAEENVTDEECQNFYQKYSKELTVEQPIIQGVFVKLLLNSSKVETVKGWLRSLNDGKTDCIEAFDQFGTQRAVDYDNFFDTWIDLHRLTDKLPETVVDAASFLNCKTYEMKDNTYYYLFVIRDYRLTGEVQPYAYAKSDIMQILTQQRMQNLRKGLLEDLRKTGLDKGFVKINIEQENDSIK